VDVLTAPVPQRLSLVTLGVADVARARAFYEALGWRPAAFESDTVVFFDMNGVVFGIYGRDALAEDAGVEGGGQGFTGVSLAINLASPGEVDAALASACAAGGRLVKPATQVFWGGYSGYFADLDGHLWEVAHNPHWPLDQEGRPQIPPPAR
jgi:catechol 2,3-dioxygenase-like lactoylglutathione lyase family enzyme